LRDHASNYASFSGFGISYWWAKFSSLCLQYYAVVATIFLHVYERERERERCVLHYIIIILPFAFAFAFAFFLFWPFILLLELAKVKDGVFGRIY
jgi:ABC-type multidrug transport system permease subunit